MIQIDKVQRVEGVTVFGDHDPNAFNIHYLFPERATIPILPNGKLPFSFYKYRFAVDRPDGKKGGGFCLFDTAFVIDQATMAKVTPILESQIRAEANRRGLNDVPPLKIGTVAYTEGEVSLIIAAALLLFEVPMEGNALALYFAVLIFIAANLTLGITVSSLARNQLQAMQMTFFFFLPSILLSGFMFPFRGMPEWAQWLGTLLPLTHFLHLVRGIMLKGTPLLDLWPQIWPLFAFMLAVIAIGVRFYKRTLD